jgi:uncharacterized membrane protein YfcA
MSFGTLLPVYFQWWHLPVIFLVGILAESYGSIVGSGSVVTQWALAAIGMPLRSVIATDISAALGTDVGIAYETREVVAAQKKIVFVLMISILAGGIVGTRLLTASQSPILKAAVLFALFFLLISLSHRILVPVSAPTPSVGISKKQWVYLVASMVAIGIYSNAVSVGEGTFGKLALMSILGTSFIGSHGMKSAAMIPARIYALVVTAFQGLVVLPYLLTLWCSNFIAGKYATRFIRRVPERVLEMLLVVVVIGYMMFLLLS